MKSDSNKVETAKRWKLLPTSLPTHFFNSSMKTPTFSSCRTLESSNGIWMLSGKHCGQLLGIWYEAS